MTDEAWCEAVDQHLRASYEISFAELKCDELAEKLFNTGFDPRPSAMTLYEAATSRVRLIADNIRREPGESDAIWKERVRRFLDGPEL